MGANAATMLLLAHHLELALYGLFVTAVGVQLLLSRVILLGMDGSVMRLRTLPELSHRAEEVVRAGLVILRITSAVLLLAALAAAVMTSRILPHWPFWAPLAIAAGAMGIALVDYACCDRLARLQYRAAALFLGGAAVARLLVTAVALLLTPRQPAVIFLAYASTSLLIGLGQTVLLNSEARASCSPRSPRPESALVRRLFRVSLWKAGTDVGTLLAMNQGVFLLTLLGHRVEAGLFGLGLVLSQGFFAVNLAFFDYLMSRVMRVSSPAHLQWFLVRAFGMAIAVALACIPVTLGIRWVLPWLLRPEQLSVVPTFYRLAGTMLLLILQCPLLVTCYFLVRPHRVLIALVLQVAVTAALGLSLVGPGREGAEGAAVAQLLGSAVGTLVLAGWVTVALRSARRSGPSGEAFHVSV